MPNHRYGANRVLDAIYGSGDPAELFLALTHTEPSFSTAGADLDEPEADSYERLAIANDQEHFPDAEEGTKVNGEALIFPRARERWGTIRYWAILDARDGGSIIDSGRSTPHFVREGHIVQFNPGAIKVRVH